jgi:cytochrome c oxidase assembly protein subunit 15
MGSAGLVFAVIVVGGVTRLTESGLSITEWKPITGTIPPLNQEEWMVEFEKYKATPEFKLWVFLLLQMVSSLELNGRYIQVESLHELGGIQEYFLHGMGSPCSRRVIGVAFVLPLAYFAARKKLTATSPNT